LRVTRITQKVADAHGNLSSADRSFSQVRERRNAMRRQTWMFIGLGMFLVFSVSLAAAQMPMGGHMQRHGPMMGMKMPAYDAATEVTLKGSVEAVKATGRMEGRGGTHLTIKTEKETIDVRVGPTWFLAEHKMSFVKGDKVEVTGSHVKFGTEEVVLAREIKKGDQTLPLRDKQGMPVWSHRHMMHMFQS
jgi:hypothetical protein